MKPLRFFSGIALTALSLPIFAYAAPVDTLVGQLGGDNEKARSEARQLLPREGVSIIPKVLPLVSSENIHVWTAAFNTLSDVANEVSGPGRDADRTLATDYFMTLLAPEQPADIKIRGLRLVTITLPEGYIVSPIAALLTDADLRDKARSALQESGTDKACVALVRALRTADPAFQAALLDSIAFMKNETCAERVVRYTKSEAPIVRASAARAIAWTGDIKYIDEIRAVRVEADDATKFDADDAAIRFADARARNHADHATAITLYTEVLSTSKLYASRNAALVGLVRHGDSNTAATIVAALNGEGGRDLEPAVRSAFENATTENAKQVIVALYPQLSNEARLDILGAFGRKRDAAYIGLMTDGAQSSDAGVRVAAYTALADSQLLEAGPVLVAATAKATGEEKAAAVSELLRLAHALGAVGHTKEAGSAYFAAYNAAEVKESRATALIGVATYPTTEATETLMKAVETGELAATPDLLAKIAKGLKDAGRTAEADRATALLIAKATNGQAVQAILELTKDNPNLPDLAHRLGFVTSYQVVGPFPWSVSEKFTVSHVNESAVDVKAQYTAGNATLAWKPFATPDRSGIVDLSAATGGNANATAYALATITVPAATDAVARMGSDDGIKLWVNGVVAHENSVDRGTQVDQDQAPIKLNAGANQLLVQVTQGGGGWNFCLRLTTADGTPLAFEEAK